MVGFFVAAIANWHERKADKVQQDQTDSCMHLPENSPWSATVDRLTFQQLST
jgi:hypothetical protein